MILYYLSGSKWVYKYDKKGNKIELISFNANGDFRWKWTYKYDNKGNQLECAYRCSQGSSDKYTNSYKHYGEVNEIGESESNWMYPQTLDRKATLRFNNNGRKIKETITYYNRDEKGQKIEKFANTLKEPLKWEEVSKFEYDSNGNWIKKVDFKITN